MSEFISELKDHALQRDEKIDIVFDLVCMLAKDKKPAEYEKIKEKWNDGKHK